MFHTSSPTNVVLLVSYFGSVKFHFTVKCFVAYGLAGCMLAQVVLRHFPIEVSSFVTCSCKYIACNYHLYFHFWPELAP
jgi:hypothetical protein